MSQDVYYSKAATSRLLLFASDFIAGMVGGSAGLVVGHPFDTIKVQQQIAAFNHVPSLRQCSGAILREEGVRGFFRGMGFPLIAVGAIHMTYFGVYGNTVRFLENIRQHKTNQPSMLVIFLAGGVAGGVQAVVATPIELIKCRLQAQRQEQHNAQKQGLKALTQHSGPVDCLRHVYQTKGFSGCFRGMNATVMRDVASLSTYIVMYEWLNLQMTPEGQTTPPVRAMFFNGGLAGALTWILIFPVDVIKSRLQATSGAHFHGFRHCLEHSYRHEGWRSFYRGLHVTCLRAFPSNAVTLTIYSLLQRWIQETSLAATTAGP